MQTNIIKLHYEINLYQLVYEKIKFTFTYQRTKIKKS